MRMKIYLIETFRFNSNANKRLLQKLDQPPDMKEASAITATSSIHK